MLVGSRFLAFASGFVVVSGLGIYAGWADARTPEAFASLAGRWAGQGIVTPASGRAENFKCVVTYIPDGDSTRLRQNLRCKSENYRLDAATHLQLDGAQVTGHWQDNIYTGLNGTVSGILTDGGFDVTLRGRFFQAKMTVEGSRCEQSVTVKPERADYIREVSASLKKC
jgi:hypothetical protein